MGARTRRVGGSMRGHTVNPKFAVCAALIAVSGPAWAGGFLNATQSVTSAGVANAGQTALAEDAATVAYNPAGLARLDRSELLFASGLSFGDQSFSHGVATDAAGVPINGNSSTSPQPFIQPSLFAAFPLAEGLHAGLGVFVPFGQSTKYEGNWIGRYQVQQVTLKTVDIRPAASYLVNQWLSVGAGIDVIYAHFQRTNAIDFGALCFGQVGPVACGARGLVPTAADGRLLAKVEDWTIGYDLGVLVEPTSTFRIGVNYRSGAHNNLSGSAEFNVPPAATILTAGGAFQDTTVKTSLPFPAILSAGAAYRINEYVTGLIDLSWTQWSDVQQLAVTFGNATLGTTQPLHWHDSWRGSIGAIFALDDATDLRAGFGFDQTPVPDQFRTADLPQGNSVLVALGIRHRLTPSLELAGSYGYSHWVDAPLNYATPTGGSLAGMSRENAHSLGMQMRLTL
jgi:long-chain fatty acid transport protein